MQLNVVSKDPFENGFSRFIPYGQICFQATNICNWTLSLSINCNLSSFLGNLSEIEIDIRNTSEKM